MNLAGSIRSFWSGARATLAGSHKTTVVICPTAELPAEVGLDPAHGMESCSRWPELQDCSQSCTPQVKFSAEELEDFTARYEGNKCAVWCGINPGRLVPESAGGARSETCNNRYTYVSASLFPRRQRSDLLRLLSRKNANQLARANL